MKLSDNAISQLDFRKRKTSQKMKGLESLLTGRQVSILPYVQDETGVYSEKKIQAFIKKLLDSLKRYKQYETKNPKYKLSDNEKEFYTAYLYCTIRGMTASTYGAYMSIAPCLTYEDIVNMAKNPETVRIHTPEELHYEELYEPVTGGFFGYMDETYELLTGENIAATITEAEKSRVFEIFPDAIEIERQWKELEEFETGISEEDYAEIMQDDYYYGEAEAEVDNFIKEIYEERQKWVQNFGDKTSFCEHYKKYREIYFEVERYHFAADIENMIDLFLMEQEISCFGDEDAFLKAYTMIGQSYTRMKKLLREGE